MPLKSITILISQTMTNIHETKWKIDTIDIDRDWKRVWEEKERGRSESEEMGESK